MQIEIAPKSGHAESHFYFGDQRPKNYLNYLNCCSCSCCSPFGPIPHSNKLKIFMLTWKSNIQPSDQQAVTLPSELERLDNLSLKISNIAADLKPVLVDLLF